MIAGLTTDIQTAALTGYDDDGFPYVGLDGEAEQVNLQPAEALHPLGFIARPKDPDADAAGTADVARAALVLRLSEGNVDHAVALSDPRAVPALPRLPKGSAMAYAPSGSDDPPRMLFRGDDEHIVIHVPGTAKVTIEVEGGAAIVIDNGAVHLGADGGDFVLRDPGGAFTAWLASVTSALAAAGHPVGPAPTITATKVRAV